MLLILLWAALVVPGALKARNTSPHVTVGGFEHAMNVLRSEGHDGGRGRRVMVPDDAGRIVARPVGDHLVPQSMPSEDPVIVRRRLWFVRALLATGISLGLALLLGGGAWLLFAGVAVASAVYVVVLRHLKLQRDAARDVVRELDLDDQAVATTGQVAVGGEDSWVGSGTVRLRRWDG